MLNCVLGESRQGLGTAFGRRVLAVIVATTSNERSIGVKG
jgi:hypothetical protein